MDYTKILFPQDVRGGSPPCRYVPKKLENVPLKKKENSTKHNSSVGPSCFPPPMEPACLDSSASHERPAVPCAQACLCLQKVVRPPRGVRLGRVLCAAATVVSHTLLVRKHQLRKKLSPAAAPTSLPPCLQLTGAIRKLHVKLPLTMKTPWTTRQGQIKAGREKQPFEEFKPWSS